MLEWRTMRVMLLTPLLMLALIACAVWYGYDLPLPAFLDWHLTTVSSPSPRVEAAVSIPAPVVDPVVHIDVPDKSIFAP